MGESRTSKAIGLIALEVPQIVLKRVLSESMDLLYQNCARNCAYTLNRRHFLPISTNLTFLSHVS